MKKFILVIYLMSIVISSMAQDFDFLTIRYSGEPLSHEAIIESLGRDVTYSHKDNEISVSKTVFQSAEEVFSFSAAIIKHEGIEEVELVLPSIISTIGAEAFLECSTLTSVIIPDSVTEIGEYAFAYCEALTNMVIPSSVTKINNGAFGECTRLANITIPDSVTEIGEEAFAYCEALTNITIPDSVTEIGE